MCLLFKDFDIIMLTPTLGSVNDRSQQIIADMIRNQLCDVASDKRLTHMDFQRIVRYVNTNIFVPGVCSLWQGYVTDRKMKNKGSYINFYFRKKKVALHRLLYLNFLGPLAEDEYVTFKCCNKGHCCSVYCLEKHRYRRIPPNYFKSTSYNSPSSNQLSSKSYMVDPEERLNVYFI